MDIEKLAVLGGLNPMVWRCNDISITTIIHQRRRCRGGEHNQLRAFLRMFHVHVVPPICG